MLVTAHIFNKSYNLTKWS